MKKVFLAFLTLGVVAACRSETVTLFGLDRRPVLSYEHAASPFKPYVAQLYSPGGVAVLRDAPSDHLHHHALMFGLSVENVSFWEELPANGKQVPQSLKQEHDRVLQELDWTAPDGRILLHEDRVIQIHQKLGREVTLLTWHSRLRVPQGRSEVQLAGRNFYGLGVRFVESMDRVGEFRYSAGAEGEPLRGTQRLTTAEWCAYTAPVAGSLVTVAVFDHPDNLSHPSSMFTMTSRFAYIASTLDVWKEPHTLESGHPLVLRYGVAVWDGRVESAAIQTAYESWAKSAKTTTTVDR